MGIGEPRYLSASYSCFGSLAIRAAIISKSSQAKYGITMAVCYRLGGVQLRLQPSTLGALLAEDYLSPRFPLHKAEMLCMSPLPSGNQTGPS